MSTVLLEMTLERLTETRANDAAEWAALEANQPQRIRCVPGMRHDFAPIVKEKGNWRFGATYEPNAYACEHCKTRVTVKARTFSHPLPGLKLAERRAEKATWAARPLFITLDRTADAAEKLSALMAKNPSMNFRKAGAA